MIFISSWDRKVNLPSHLMSYQGYLFILEGHQRPQRLDTSANEIDL